MSLLTGLVTAAMLLADDAPPSIKANGAGSATAGSRLGRVAVPKDRIRLGCNRKEPESLQVSIGGSSVYFGAYEPAEPKSLDEVPEAVRRKLVAHLTDRLGPEFYRRLRFAGGQVVDFDAFHKAVPSWKDYQWEVFKYRLQFAIAAPDQGLTEYVAHIELNAAGAVIKEIGLPAVSTSPEKAKIFPLAKARQTAGGMGIATDCADTTIEYDLERGSLIWVFSEVVADDGTVITIRRVRIDAHSGKAVGDSKSNAIR